MARFVCPCCGHRTLPDRPGTRAALCEVCAWEGRDDGGWLRASGEALLAAQRTYLRTGACDPALADFTRPPRAGEARPAWWVPLDEWPGALVAELERAFAGVELAGGVSMAEANLIDDYALPARSERDPPPRGHGTGPPWQSLSLADLEPHAWGPFPFMDARGVRYYLPAILRLELRGDAPGSLDSLVYTLTDGHQLASIHALLDVPQHTVVARWLLYHALAPTRLGPRTARSALRAGWSAHLDPDQLALLPAG